MTGPLNTSRNRNAPPIADPASHPALEEGRALFNRGEHWHAHEAWEPLWMGLEGDDKLFVQGLIMAAAMLVQYGKGVRRGVQNHWANVTLRLRPHAQGRWGVDVARLLADLAPYAEDASAARPMQRDPGAVRIHRSTRSL
ncbi:MAG TPA: DUF309 domain-containing protein [Candidatus Thermoplasmatota archaeon]|nr:DUF309 domain-containing protein [Candidatus Thermoplasmatota archaeon]